MPSLEALRLAHRAAEESEYAAERAMSEVLERLEKLRQSIQSSGASRRRSMDTQEMDEIRRKLEALERERADLVQEKVHCGEILEKARRRTREARNAWQNAELQAARIRSQIPEQERVLARQKQLVAEAEYELERRREHLRELERTLDLLRRELITMAGH